jgi:hypothetical protein
VLLLKVRFKAFVFKWFIIEIILLASIIIAFTVFNAAATIAPTSAPTWA